MDNNLKRVIRAKKFLSQNFLKSSRAIKLMCDVTEIHNNEIVIEIGPGKGALTEKILEKVSKVIAIEKDLELIEYLKEKFESEINSGRLILINDDVLEIKLEDFEKYGILNKKYKIIANIPYNITGLILRKFLSSDIQPKTMTILVQKEVAERIVSRNGKESILSISVKAYGKPFYIEKVSKRFFSPSPKVDSAIISIKDISKNNFTSEKQEGLFFKIIKSGFAHKRKVLRKNLEESGLSKELIEWAFNKLEIDSKIRAEKLELKKWLSLVKLTGKQFG